jgi:type II secretory pathway pseudopilin PulG
MRRAAGFTYMTILFIVAIMGVGLALVGEVWHTAATREKEAELLFVGNQYRRAIERYYLSGPKQYPRALEDLLRDQRKPGIERHLRRLYHDPLTGKAEWGLVKGPDGGVMGVHSLATGKPLKTTGFRVRDRELEGAATYADWKFLYSPAAQQAPLQKPGAPLPQNPPQQPGAAPTQAPLPPMQPGGAPVPR